MFGKAIFITLDGDYGVHWVHTIMITKFYTIDIQRNAKKKFKNKIISMLLQFHKGFQTQTKPVHSIQFQWIQIRFYAGKPIPWMGNECRISSIYDNVAFFQTFNWNAVYWTT